MTASITCPNCHGTAIVFSGYISAERMFVYDCIVCHQSFDVQSIEPDPDQGECLDSEFSDYKPKVTK